MSQRQREETVPKPAEAINGFDGLYARQISFNAWTVLSLRNGDVTAWRVNLEDLQCACSDNQYNKRGGEVCDHIAVALYAAPQVRSAEEYGARGLSQEIRAAREAAQDLRQSATAWEADAKAAKHSEPSTTAQDDQGDDRDPLTALQDAAREAGVPVDQGVKIYEHSKFPSIQVEKDGQLPDEEFEALKEFTTGDSWNYDPEEGLNYIKEDDVWEVVG